MTPRQAAKRFESQALTRLLNIRMLHLELLNLQAALQLNGLGSVSDLMEAACAAMRDETNKAAMTSCAAGMIRRGGPRQRKVK